ncbi:extracellular solute-binding protein [Phytoactinopolyspora halotolerans]|uniref:Extracellular solute-binding protein n=1 Tax=Phytoactinopolyspora halotolerans TaxID=1981512 RepID=A0A6L9SED9_9ACTN|nr:extracellular solute-binding protein [Phytoactinopolyspora halotolerans]NEE02862.1 extracellular solute-binding protein [Phytoactinopolyspora halotolerans]
MTLHRLRPRTVLAATAALALGLAACGSDDGGGGDTDGGTDTISLMIPLLESQAPAEDGELQQAIEEYTGKNLDITWVPNSNYEDRTSVAMASDDVPQVMVIQGKTPAFVQSAEAGAFWDLTEIIHDYPNLAPANEQIHLNSSINGTNYGIFRARDEMRAAVVIRKDWMENLGYDLPETVDDLYELARAFTEDDPDGNGEDDTYGIVIPQWPGGYATASPYDLIETWFGAPNGWGERDGRLVPGFSTPEFLEANRFVKDMIDNGFVNQDFATMDSANWNDPFFNGQGGIIVDVSSRAGSIMTLFKDADPDDYDKVTMAGNLIGPDGERHSYPTVGFNGFLAISKQSVRTEEELDEILSFLDTLNAKEGQVLLNNGIEGKNFEVTDDFAIPIEDTPDAEVITNDSKAFAQLGTATNGELFYQILPEDEPERELWDHRWAIHERDMETAVHNPALALISETYTQRGAQLDQIIADARIKYLAGQIDEDELQAEIDRWYAEGGQQVVDEMNELYADLE